MCSLSTNILRKFFIVFIDCEHAFYFDRERLTEWPMD
jgi:hypothetical protein